jgi:hypothetical protein
MANTLWSFTANEHAISSYTILSAGGSNAPLLVDCRCSSAGVYQLGPAGRSVQGAQGRQGRGEGGWDYIYAESVGRRLYIPRGAARAISATEKSAEVAAVPARLTIFDLDTLKPIGKIAGIAGNGYSSR